MHQKSHDTQSDQEIIEEVVSGNQHAFAKLVERYEPTVASVIVAMLGNHSEAEDVGQEVMVKLYRSLKKFRHEASLKTYVTRIAVNTALDRLRKRKRYKTIFQNGDDEIEQKTTTQSIAEGEIDRSDQRQAILYALSQLDEAHRAVVVLRLIHQYDTKEVADMLNTPEGTILSRLARSKKKLAEVLNGIGVEYD